MEQQRHPGAGHLVRSGTVENDVAVARNLLFPMLDLIHGHVQRAADQRRVPFEFSLRPQIQNHWALTRFLLLPQFIHGNPRHPQLVQQPVSLEIFVADVKRNQSDDDAERAMTKTGERINDLFQLLAE